MLSELGEERFQRTKSALCEIRAFSEKTSVGFYVFNGSWPKGRGEGEGVEVNTGFQERGLNVGRA